MPGKRTLYFTAPGVLEVREDPIPEPAADQVLVKTLCSAISPGTEMLVYRGQFPADLPVDMSISGMQGQFSYPLAYGYAAVGRIIDTGRNADKGLQDKLVFAFQPHTTHFALHPDSLFLVPEGISPETACFLPNMETAVNLVQDAAPMLGERALVYGQGIIGLLTAALLAEFPLASLVTCDYYPIRRQASQNLGASAALDPNAPDFQTRVRGLLPTGADLTFEISGSPSALDDAVALTGFGGRVVIGSWYGNKSVSLDLGGSFHRSRIRLISSQVSTIAPELTGRWDKARRFGVAWDALERIRPEKWITHRFALEGADQAYGLLDQHPEETIQVILTTDEQG